jgi:hypothetical protein
MTKPNDEVKYCVPGIDEAGRDVGIGDVQRTAA